MKKEYRDLASYLGVDYSELRDRGVFNITFPIDNNFYVDVFLLKGSAIKEFRGSYDTFMGYFSRLTQFVLKSKRENDLPWKTALKMASFGEQKGFLLGHAKTKDGGSGIGPEFGAKLVGAISEMVEIDIDDPESFMFIPFIEPGIGCDRISDMTCSILKHDFATYTERVLKELGYRGLKEFSIDGKKYKLAPLPWKNNTPLLFVPKTFVRRLPGSYDWEDIFDYYSLHNTFRDKVSQALAQRIGADKVNNKNNIKKENLKEVFFSDPAILKKVVNEVQKHFPLEIELQKIAKEVSGENPLKLDFKVDSPESAINVVRKICEQYKFLIENKKIWTKLYQANSPLHEEFAQAFFYTLAHSYCLANKLDISPEYDSGLGRVDFRILKEVEESVLVEMKLSAHRFLKHGYEEQLPAYIKSTSPKHSFYLIVKVVDYSDCVPLTKKENAEKFESKIKKEDRKVREIEKLHESSGNKKMDIVVVDAYPKLSASIPKK